MFDNVLTQKFVAIKPVEYTKVESKVEGGFARIAQKTDVISVPLVMGFMWSHGQSATKCIPSQCEVVLRGDSHLQPWKQKVHELEGERFVLCPAEQIVAIHFKENDK